MAKIHDVFFILKQQNMIPFTNFREIFTENIGKKKFKMAYSKKLRFSKLSITKISQIGPWVSRID